MSSMFKVVLPMSFDNESAKYPNRFRELGAVFVGKQCSTDDEFITFALDADALITSGSRRPVTRKIIEHLGQCKLICNVQIGYDTIDIDAASERGILVTNVPSYCVEEVSDHAMALILACSRRVVLLDKAVKKGLWGFGTTGTEIQKKIRPKMNRLKGQTLGLVGFGEIARALVPKAKGFQLRIIAYDPYAEPEAAQKISVEMVAWKSLLRESDFISIHAALTSETRHIFGYESFKEMKPTSCLINTARGGLIDEESLYKALVEGKISMAALDVAESEPPNPKSPLLTMDNVICTGHSAFYSPYSVVEQWQRPVEEVARIMRGEWPKSIVNPEAKDKYIARWGEMKEPS